jgi:hypothetical protein
MEGSGTPEIPQEAHYALLSQDILRFLERPHQPLAPPSAPSAPPGSPIGDPGRSWLDWDRSLAPRAWHSPNRGWWE